MEKKTNLPIRGVRETYTEEELKELKNTVKTYPLTPDECYIMGYDPYDKDNKPSKSEMVLHPKAIKFLENMQKELVANRHKGFWEEWKNVSEILNEFDYHYTKLRIDIDAKELNKDDVKEHIADCANILMFLGNAYNLYDNEI